MRFVIAALLVATLPATNVLAEELPADREPLGAPRRAATEEASLHLPLLETPPPDAGSRSWASTDAATIQREAHLRKVAAAYGAAGAFTGMTVTSWLVSTGQVDPGVKRGWQYAAWTSGGIAAVGLVTGTVLWAMTPPAPGRPRFALGPSGGLSLTVNFY